MSREKLFTILLAPLALLVVGGLVLPLVLDSLKASPSAHVRIGDVVVAHGWDTPTNRPGDDAEFALHNTGESSAVLQRVSFEIVSVAQLRLCHNEGELGVAKGYGVALPLPATPGERVESAPLRRQLGPDEAERLAFRFALSADREGDAGVYRLKAWLWHDGKAEPTSLGDLTVSAGPNPKGQVFLRTSFDSTGEMWGPSFAGNKRVLRCLRDNTVRLNRMLAFSGPHPTFLTKLRGRLLSPSAANAVFTKYAGARN